MTDRSTDPDRDTTPEAPDPRPTVWHAGDARPRDAGARPVGPQRLAPFQPEAPHRRSSSPGTQTPRHPMPPRRRRWWRAAAATGALVMLPFVPLEDPRDRADAERDDSAGAEGGHDPLDDLTSASVATLEASRIAYRQRDRSDAVAPAGEETERDAIAVLGDLELARISEDSVVIGFHEAYGDTTLSVEPSGPVHENHNPGKSRVAPDADAPVEPKAMVLPPRDRASGPHSAIDVAIPVGSQVRSPVTGTVVNAAPYALYGKHADTRIEIIPDDRPDVVVIMLHVTGARVAPGDRVVAGETVVADSPTQFPFRSQIDRFAEAEVGRALPHVHIELKRVA